MKKLVFIIVVFIFLLSGCKKNNKPRISGIDTIENTLHGSGPYYAYGFSFSLAEKISTLDDPGPDITLIVDRSDGRLILQTNNFKNSFYKVGEYADATTASLAFKNLTTIGSYTWIAAGDPIIENQVWVFKTESEHYAKFRIINTSSESVSGITHAECTFEWVYQPDGSLTFPGK